MLTPRMIDRPNTSSRRWASSTIMRSDSRIGAQGPRTSRVCQKVDRWLLMIDWSLYI